MKNSMELVSIMADAMERHLRDMHREPYDYKNSLFCCAQAAYAAMKDADR